MQKKLFVLIVLIFFGAGCNNKVAGQKETVGYQIKEIENIERDAVLSLEADNNQLRVGDKFMVDVVLDAKDKLIDGVDIILNYDRGILEVVENRIEKGAVLDNLVYNKVDGENGRIIFSVISQPGQPSKKSGVVARLNFEVTASGKTEIGFEFESGVTIDTNVVSQGQDVLGKVNNLYIRID